MRKDTYLILSLSYITYTINVFFVLNTESNLLITYDKNKPPKYLKKVYKYLATFIRTYI